MTEPAQPTLRVGAEDRRRYIDAVSDAFADARLTEAEFDRRMSALSQPLTYADAEALLEGLPRAEAPDVGEARKGKRQMLFDAGAEEIQHQREASGDGGTLSTRVARLVGVLSGAITFALIAGIGFAVIKPTFGSEPVEQSQEDAQASAQLGPMFEYPSINKTVAYLADTYGDIRGVNFNPEYWSATVSKDGALINVRGATNGVATEKPAGNGPHVQGRDFPAADLDPAAIAAVIREAPKVTGGGDVQSVTIAATTDAEYVGKDGAVSGPFITVFVTGDDYGKGEGIPVFSADGTTVLRSGLTPEGEK